MQKAYGFLVSTAAAALMALPAVAQQSQDDGAGDAASAGQGSPDRVTCQQFSTLDTALVPGALYFIAGYGEGARSGAAGGMEGGAGMTGGDAASSIDTGTVGAAGVADGATDAADDGPTGVATVAPGGPGDASIETGTTGAAGVAEGETAAAGAASDADATAGGDATGQTGGADMAGGGAGGADTSAAGDAAGSGAAGITLVRGFYEIPVERVIVACAEAPDRSVADVMREQQGAAGGQQQN